MHFGCSSLGWIDNDLDLYWLKNCFKPATREKAAGKTRLDQLLGTGVSKSEKME